MSDTLTIRRPDDWHVHLRDGNVMRGVLPYTARQFARAIVMPNLSPPVTDVAAPSGQTIAVQTGTTYVEKVQALNDAVVAKGGKPLDVQLYPKATDVFQQVMIGRAFAGSSQDTEISYRDLQTPGQLATVYTFPDKSSFGIYLRKDSADLAAVQAAVKALRENGKLGEIAGAWKLSPSQIDAAAQ